MPADKLALYDALISTIEGVERKGAAVPYTSLNGHMFSLLDEVDYGCPKECGKSL